MVMSIRTSLLTPCVEYAGARVSGGYGSRWIDGVWGMTHRQAWEDANGPIPDGMHVLHSCDNKPCINPEHLFLGTHRDNMRDSAAKGRHKNPVMYGEDNPRGAATLRAEHIPLIRELVRRGLAQTRVAKLVGVRQPAISRIVAGATWAWI